MIPVMDAYVDRHMMDFDVSPDLSSISLNNGNEISYLSIKLSIPLK
jgi:hypothetical protein